MKKNQKTFMAVGVILILLAFAIGHATSKKIIYVQSNTQDSNATQTVKPAPKKQEFKGDKDTATAPFHLNKGSARFAITYSGNLGLAAILVDTQGKSVALLASTGPEPYSGTTIENIETAGEYSVKIKSDTAWTVIVEQ